MDSINYKEKYEELQNFTFNLNKKFYKFITIHDNEYDDIEWSKYVVQSPNIQFIRDNMDLFSFDIMIRQDILNNEITEEAEKFLEEYISNLNIIPEEFLKDHLNIFIENQSLYNLERTFTDDFIKHLINVMNIQYVIELNIPISDSILDKYNIR
jgi:hypothetical protein